MTNMGWWLAVSGSTWWKVTTTCAADFESNFTCFAPWEKNSGEVEPAGTNFISFRYPTLIPLENPNHNPYMLSKWGILSDSLSLCFCWLNHDCFQRPLYLKIIWRNCCKNQPVRQCLTTFAAVFVLCCFCGKRDTLYWMNMHSMHAGIRTAEMAPSSFLQQDCSKIDDSFLYLSFRGTHTERKV